MNKEIIFKDIKFNQIKDFPNYYVSKCGKVLSTNYRKTKNLHLLKLQIDKDGYARSMLYNNKYKKLKQVHRLAAETFIHNSENKPCVNHIDGNKLNNNVNNLEWCTYSENEKHSYKMLNKKPNKTNLNKKGILSKLSRKIEQYDLNNNLIKVWDSMMDIERELGYYQSNVSKVCNNKKNKAYGYTWKFTK